jgi:membrane associated rhomboid family serine protease
VAVAQPRPWVTALLVASCAGVFAGMAAWHGLSDALELPASLLDRWDLSPPEVWTGEAWRGLAAAFVHSDVGHLLLCVVALSFLGPPVERALGPGRTLLLLLMAQVAAASLTLCFGDLQPQLGASAFAYAFLGAQLVVAHRQGEAGQPALRRAGWWVFVGFYLTAGVPGMDLLGHLGGLLAGVAGAWGLEPGGDRGARRATVAGFSGLLAVMCGVALHQPIRADWNAAHGYALYHQEDCAQALPYFEKALAANAGDYRLDTLHASVGDCLLRQGERDGGLATLRAAMGEGSVLAAVRLSLEVAPEERLALASEAEQMEPLNAQARRNLLTLLLAELDDGRLPDAKSIVALSKLPALPETDGLRLAWGLSEAMAGRRDALRGVLAEHPEWAGVSTQDGGGISLVAVRPIWMEALAALGDAGL